MKRLLYPLAALLIVATFSGCATMSKKECENADWRAVGYNDGSRGIYVGQLEKHRKSCSKYSIVPDDVAYRDGWEQGIRRYCTYDTGFRTGNRGARHLTYCPADVAPDYLSGWDEGVRRYCEPDHALQLGLSGFGYNGVCPADMAGEFQDLYRLGRDVRQARAAHHKLEARLDRTERALLAAKNRKQHRELLHDLALLRHDEHRSDNRVIALEACMSGDWFDAGYRDGEAGTPARAADIADTCRNYGILPDRRGYQDGWREGNSLYCSYDSGLYAGQNNLEYLGVCSGRAHRQFWRGYEKGREMFRHEQYEKYHRPVGREPSRRPAAGTKLRYKQTPQARPAPKHPAQAKRPQDNGKAKGQHNDNGRDVQHGHGKPAAADRNSKGKEKASPAEQEPRQRMQDKSMEQRPMEEHDMERMH